MRPRLKARVAGSFYLLTILLGVAALAVRGTTLGRAADLLSAACYVAVTLLFYSIFKPVNRTLSLVAACVSMVGITIGVFGRPLHLNPLIFFGFYCLLIGYLILRSTFLPRILALVMALAGLAWLTFLSAPLANYLAPFNMAVGGIAETFLCLWLLVVGLDAQRWSDQAQRQQRVRAVSVG